MKLLILFPFLITFSLSTFAQTQKNLTGFQNIPWGSNIEFVKNKLPNSTVIDGCGDIKEFKEIHKKNDLNCRSVVIEKYQINNIDLMLKASFNSAGRLERIVINKIYSSNDFMSQCDTSYQQLMLLLETRYGTSETPSVIGNGIFPYKKYDIKVWLPLPTEIWLAKAYDIDDFYKNRGKSLVK